MKKILSILSILIIILMLFTSCDSVSEPPVVPSETSFPSETVDIKPTERPTQKPTEKPTEPEPIVIPPREVTWDTTKYSMFYVPTGYLLALPEQLKEYYSMFREQEDEPAIPTISRLYEVDLPEDTITVKFLGEEYTGTYRGNYVGYYALSPAYTYRINSHSLPSYNFAIDDTGELSNFVLRPEFSAEKAIVSLEECEEKAKEYFSIQFPELDITEYQMTSYIPENSYGEIDHEGRRVAFTKYFHDDFAQEEIYFTFNANGELKRFGHNIFNRPSDNIDLSKIDMEEVYDAFRKASEYAFHIDTHLYPNFSIKLPEKLNRVVLNDGSLAYHGEIECVNREGLAENIKHIFVKILPQE